ncbi:putative ABC-type phosphate transporter [Helianthus anomalus]
MKPNGFQKPNISVTVYQKSEPNRISNSAGTLAAIISTIGTGYFVQWLGSFQAFLTVTACLYFATAIFWNLFATGERVF